MFGSSVEFPFSWRIISAAGRGRSPGLRKNLQAAVTKSTFASPDWDTLWCQQIEINLNLKLFRHSQLHLFLIQVLTFLHCQPYAPQLLQVQDFIPRPQSSIPAPDLPQVLGLTQTPQPPTSLSEHVQVQEVTPQALTSNCFCWPPPGS